MSRPIYVLMLAVGHIESIRPKLGSGGPHGQPMCTVQAVGCNGMAEGTKRHPSSSWVRTKIKRSLSGLFGKISPPSSWLRIDRATSPKEKRKPKLAESGQGPNKPNFIRALASLGLCYRRRVERGRHDW